jgi:hypothetical protein
MLRDIKKGLAEYKNNVASIPKVDLATRVRSAPVPRKEVARPEVDRTDPYWQDVYRDAVQSGHPLPEKLADSLVRARQKTREVKEARAKIEITNKPPPKEGESVKVATVNTCKAVLLSGKPCTFAAKCGKFCSRHSQK